MDAEKFDVIVRTLFMWGIGAVAVALAAQKFLF